MHKTHQNIANKQVVDRRRTNRQSDRREPQSVAVDKKKANEKPSKFNLSTYPSACP